ncbi:hydrogenase formation protein HypD [Acidobacteriota bacterium]
MDSRLLREEKSVRTLLKDVERSLSRIGREIKLMEVCGTHTMTAFRSGLGNFLRKIGLRLISGPGCPVCITPNGIISAAVEFVTETPNVIVTTFGDMLKVPTNRGSLMKVVPDKGSTVKTIYSPEEVIDLAVKNPDKQIVFLAVGFETTIPTIGWVVEEALKKEYDNVSLLTCLRVVPPPLRAILSSGDVAIDGFIYPGHVSVILGTQPYEFIPKEFGIPGAITGFEPVDLLLGVISVLKQIESREPIVDIAYPRMVKREGNPLARQLIDRVFEVEDGEWRGFGIIPGSGLGLRGKKVDAVEKFSLNTSSSWENKNCRCGDVVKGAIEPPECPLFRKVCSPEKPMGPCMVSVEGSCLIHYKYGDVEWIA